MTDELEDRPKAEDDVKVPAPGDLPTRDSTGPPTDPEAETTAGTDPQENQP